MINIDDKAIIQPIYFPRTVNVNYETYDLTLISEITNKSYSFSGLTDESNSKNYFKFLVDFSQVDDGEYNFSISDVSSGLIRIGQIIDSLPEQVSYSPFSGDEGDYQIIQYNPNDEIRYRFQPNKVVEIYSNGVVNVKPDSGYTALLNAEIHVDIQQTNQDKSIVFTENAVTSVTYDEGYEGLGKVDIEVNVPVDDYYNSGYTSGYTDGYTSGSTVGYNSGYTVGYDSGKTDGITEGYESGFTGGYNSGYTDGFNTGYTSGCTDGYIDGYGDGYSSGSTDGYNSGYTGGYSSGKTDGVAEQKSKLVETAVTENGIYTKEDGFKKVQVTIPVQDYFNSGYTSGYTVGYTSGSTDGYNSGYTGGYSSGKTDGVAEQKSKLVSTAFTGNGTYIKEDGFNSVTVNVPTQDYYNSGYTSGYTDGYSSGSTVGYNSGYTVGYDSGKTDGIEEQKSKLTSTAVTINGTYTKVDGFSSVTVNVAQTGHTDAEILEAYNSGITEGVTEQKSKLTSTAFTGNGTYTKEDGYSSVTVNVPTQDYFNSGYTSGYTVGYSSGSTDGYNSGYTGGYSSGKTDGVAEQKSKLITTAVTSNGVYARADGYSLIDVQVPTGSTINNQTKNVSATTNGTSTITFDAGYTGLEKVNLLVDIDTQAYFNSGYTSGFTAGYSSGTTDGFNTGYTSGKTDGIIEGYESGFTGGYNSGYTDGYAAGSSGAVQMFELTVVVSSDSGSVVGEASVIITYGSSSETITYTGTPIVKNIIPGIDYSVSFGSVAGFITPLSVSGFSTWSGSTTVYGQYIASGPTPYSEQYFTFGVITQGNLELKFIVDRSNKIEYSIDDGSSWTEIGYDSSVKILSLVVNPGDKVLLKGDCQKYNNTWGSWSAITAQVEVYGNIMSLVYGDNFLGQTTLPQDSAGTFNYLFNNCTGLTSAENLILPATTLAYGCYQQMFAYCTNLTKAPSILPATTLTPYCYRDMFYNCSGLTTAPELPAPILAQNCYSNMFSGCRNINNIKCLAIDTSASDCTNNWVYYVASTGTFVKSPNAQTWPVGESGIPRNWTVIDAS